MTSDPVVQLRSAKVGQEDALTEKSNLEERLRAAEADKQHLASDMEAAKTEAQNSQIEAEAVQMELQDLLDFQKTVSVAQDHHQVRLSALFCLHCVLA